MTMKKHKFTLTVTTEGNRRQAELAVLHAFSKRQPDGCKFRLGRFRKLIEIRTEIRTEYVNPYALP